jgi:hypothetical protein
MHARLNALPLSYNLSPRPSIFERNSKAVDGESIFLSINGYPYAKRMNLDLYHITYIRITSNRQYLKYKSLNYKTF